MFFIGVFGINRREKKIREANFKCTGCLNRRGDVLQRANTFEFFFIPVFKFNRKYFLRCISCGSLYQLKDEYIKEIIHSGRVDYDQIEKVVYESHICPQCGEAIGSEFKFCPRCGKKL